MYTQVADLGRDYGEPPSLQPQAIQKTQCIDIEKH